MLKSSEAAQDVANQRPLQQNLRQFLLLLWQIDIFPTFHEAALYLLDIATSTGPKLVSMPPLTIGTLQIQV